MRYNIDFDVAAMVLAITTLVHFLTKKSIKNFQTKLFFGMLWISLVSDVMDIITVLVAETSVQGWVVYLVNILYLLSFNILPFLYYLYILSMVQNPNQWKLGRKIFAWMPICVVCTLILTTPWTKWIFYNDAETGYTHGQGMIVLYIIAFWYIFLALLFSMRYRARMTFGQRSSVYYYSIAVLCGIVLQVLFPKVLLLQFATALALLLVYLALENPKDYENKELGIYNRNGFIKLVSASVEKNERFSILGIRFNGYQSVRENLGVENSQQFMKQIVDYLAENIAPLELCWLAEGTFAVYTNEKTGKLDNVIRFIQEQFNSAIKFHGIDIIVSASLFQLDYPYDVQSLEDLLDTIDYETEHVQRKENGVVVRAGKDILLKLRRENHIQQLMKMALVENVFEVYYQPIYSVEKKQFHSAEALIRLRDEELGFISPEEFIPMAEKNGMIFEIGEFVFRNVCQMMSKMRLWELGIDFIEVNLSPVQCMEEGLHRKLMHIMDEYQLPYHCINLEITETAAASTEETLRHNINPLLEKGVTFSLDDYGTGYSNISNVITYPFYIIKLDKSMVWSALEDSKAMKALKHTIAMIKELNFHIVAEGVETLEQATLLGGLGCDYLQGYYFSKPVPEEQFLNMLRNRES